jgi:hypothetical protein
MRIGHGNDWIGSTGPGDDGAPRRGAVVGQLLAASGRKGRGGHFVVLVRAFSSSKGMAERMSLPRSITFHPEVLRKIATSLRPSE